MIKVYVKGVFDIIHYGHIRFFRRAKELGDWLTVGVTPDERAIRLKRKPFFSSAMRAEVVSAIGCVDEVICDGPQEISLKFMNDNGFTLYAFGTANEAERQFRLNDCRTLPRDMVVELPYTLGISTSGLIEAIKKP